MFLFIEEYIQREMRKYCNFISGYRSVSFIKKKRNHKFDKPHIQDDGKSEAVVDFLTQAVFCMIQSTTG